MKRDNWIATKEEAERPARPDGTCFYCRIPIGEQHKESCVIRSRTVVVDVTIRTIRDVPEHWDIEDIEFHWNDGTWCADNIIGHLENQSEKVGCLCGDFSSRVVREATEQDEERYKFYVDELKS